MEIENCWKETMGKTKERSAASAKWKQSYFLPHEESNY